ncbi:hypothetical protein AB0I23_32495 [Streptomyces atratus]
MGGTRNIGVVDDPSDLGLRPPAPGTVPGCCKPAGALGEQRIVQRLGALEGGVVVPPRYDLGGRQEGDGAFDAAAIARCTRTLADRVEHHVRAGDFPLELGPLPRALAGSPRRVGLYVTVYDPDLDPDGAAGALLTDLLVAAFAEE